MPAAPLIAAVAIDATAMSATTALIGGIAASTFGVVGGAIVTGAIGGAAGGAISGAAFGGDPGMGALTGAISGGVGGGVGSPQSGITADVREAFGVSQNVAEGLTKGAAGFAGGTLGGLAQGEKFGQALKGGAVSGISSGLASGVGAALDQGANGPTERAGNERVFGNEIPGGISAPAISTPPPSGSSTSPTERNGIDRQLSGAAQSALSYGIKSGLSDLFGSNVPSSGQPTSGQPSAQQGAPNPTPSPNLVSQGPSPSVDALAQALRTVGDLGYSPGGPVFGSQSDAPQRKVWNKASLRVTDENQ